MENPIHVIDADLIPEGGPVDTVHVWYILLPAINPDCEPIDEKYTEQSDFPGHDFFMRWLPVCVQQKYQTLMNYWRSMHPYRRNEHIAAYLAERSNLYQIAQLN